MRNVFIYIVIGVCLLGFGIGLRYVNLKIEGYFQPKEQSIKRKVFEETKSYVYGAIQDIAKYYEEYEKTDEQGEDVIRNVIRQRFAKFDVNNIKSFTLRQWFVSVRGY